MSGKKDIREVIEKHLQKAYKEIQEDRGLSGNIDMVQEIELDNKVQDLAWFVERWLDPIK